MATRTPLQPGSAPEGAREEAADQREGKSSGRKRGTLSIENSIQIAVGEAGRAQERKRSETTGADSTPRDTGQALPEHIATRYIRAGKKFHFSNRELAFVDHGEKLTTRVENTEVIGDLVSIAKARGWDEISLGGSKAFKQEAWVQANVAGLTVRGYRASELDKQVLERRLAKDRSPDSAYGPTSTSAPLANSISAERTAQGERTESVSGRRAERSPAIDEVYSGRLVEHGTAPYRNDPRAQTSYYVKLETPERERVLWGIDLQRAVTESLSKAKIGDDVSVRFQGSESVTVTRPVRNSEGEVVKEPRIVTQRHRWSLERSDFAQERVELARLVRDERMDPAAAVAKHPSLAGTYTELQAARVKAEEQYPSPEERLKFTQGMRARLAQDIERGRPMPATRVSAVEKPREARELVQERAL